MFLATLLLPILVLTLGASAQTPPPVPKYPTLGAVGIGVTSLNASAKFYTEVLGMVDKGERYYTSQFDEIVLSMPRPGTGSAVVLMQWKNGRNVKDVPVKLVYYVEDVKAQVEKIRTAGGKIVSEPGTTRYGNQTIPTGMAKDLDGYLLEINPLSFLPTPKAPTPKAPSP